MNTSNTTTEQWVKWEPAPEIAGRYFVKRLVYDENGLEILLCSSQDTSKLISLLFDSTLPIYTVGDETFMMETISRLPKNCGLWTFFKVVNSYYLKELSRESSTYSDHYNFTHYALVTDDEIINVAAYLDPKVTLT